MSKKRRQQVPSSKPRVGLEALKGIEPVHAIAAKHQVHPVQVSQWKKEVAARLPEVFARKPDADAADAKAREEELYRKIGRLKMELEWLKKKLASSSVEQRRRMIEPDHPAFSVTPAVRAAGPAAGRATITAAAGGGGEPGLMRLIDETYLVYPFFGSRRMTRWLRRQGHAVNRKRVQRLMREMGLEAIYRKPNLIARTMAGHRDISVSAARPRR